MRSALPKPLQNHTIILVYYSRYIHLKSILVVPSQGKGVQSEENERN